MKMLIDVCEVKRVNRNGKIYYVPHETSIDPSRIVELTRNTTMVQNKRDGLLPEEITVEDFCDLHLDAGHTVIIKTVLGSKEYLIEQLFGPANKRKVLKG
jgi:hypothetical protein